MQTLRYVVLQHGGVAEPHFDLMLERAPGGKLRTWRSEHWPMHDGEKLHPLGDHRREYLTFEGELTGDRGHVTRVAEGNYLLVKEQSDSLTIEIESHRWTIKNDIAISEA